MRALDDDLGAAAAASYRERCRNRTPPQSSCRAMSRLVASPVMLPRLLRWPTAHALPAERRLLRLTFRALDGEARLRRCSRAALIEWRGLAVTAAAEALRAKRRVCRHRFAAWRSSAAVSAMRRRRCESARRHVCRRTLLPRYRRARVGAAFAAWFLHSLSTPKRTSRRWSASAPKSALLALPMTRPPRAVVLRVLHAALQRWTTRAALTAALRHCSGAARAHFRRRLLARCIVGWRAAKGVSRADDDFLSALLDAPPPARFGREPPSGAVDPVSRSQRTAAAPRPPAATWPTAGGSAVRCGKRERAAASSAPAAKLRKLMTLSRPATARRIVGVFDKTARRKRALAAFKRKALARAAGARRAQASVDVGSSATTSSVIATAAVVTGEDSPPLLPLKAVETSTSLPIACDTKAVEAVRAMGLMKLAQRGASRRKRRLARVAEACRATAEANVGISASLAASTSALCALHAHRTAASAKHAEHVAFTAFAAAFCSARDASETVAILVAHKSASAAKRAYREGLAAQVNVAKVSSFIRSNMFLNTRRIYLHYVRLSLRSLTHLP